MYNFLHKIFYYLLAVTVLLSFLITYVDNGLKTVDDDIFGDWNRIFGKEINDEMIIIGNSRAKVHLDPILIEKETGVTTYNLGRDATNLFMQQTLISSVIEHIKPKFLVLVVDIGSFQKKYKIFEKQQFLPYLSDENIFPVVSRIDKNLKIERYLPILKYKGQSTSIFTGIFANFKTFNSYSKIKGFYESDKKWNSDFDKFKDKMKGKKIILSEVEKLDGFRLLDQIISECKRNNIEIILCQTPRYFELNDYFPQKITIDSQIRTVADKKNISYFDFSNESLIYDKSYFYNASHLNSKGAEILTTKFSVLFKKKFSK